MKYTYKKMGVSGAKKAPKKSEKGYTASERGSMKSLIEDVADKFSGDTTGGSSITIVKKTKKRMAAGGIVGKAAKSYRDMKAGAGSGVGRIQKTKIAARGR